MSDPIPPAAHENRPRAPAEMHGTADGGWDGDDGSVMSTQLWVGGAAAQTHSVLAKAPRRRSLRSLGSEREPATLSYGID